MKGIPTYDDTGKPQYLLGISEDITERKQAEKALRESEERFRMVAESPTGMVLTNADGRIALVNRQIEQQFGYRREELLGQPIEVLLPARYRARHPELRRGYQDAPQARPMGAGRDLYGLRKDGTEFPVEIGLSPLETTEGRNVLASIVDITERKQAEEASRLQLQEAWEMQQSLLDLACLDSAELSLAEAIQHVTQVVASTIGIDRIGVWFLSEDGAELVCVDLYERCRATHSSTVKLAVENYPRYFAALKESLVVAASDARIDPRTSEFADDYLSSLGISSMMDVPIHRQGKLIGAVCYEHVGPPREWSQDIQSFAVAVCQTIVRIIEVASRKQAEESLARVAERLELATRASGIGVWDWNIRKNELIWDDRMFTLYGVKKEDCGVAYDAWLSSVHPDDRAKCDRAVQQALRNEKLYDIEFRIQRPDGMVHVIKAYGLVEWDPQGTPLRMIGINYDITARTQTEEALRESEERYRQLVNSAKDVIFTVRKDRAITSLSPSFTTVLGWDVADWVGKEFNPIVHTDDLPEVLRVFTLGFEGARHQIVEARILAKGETYIPMEITVVSQQQQGGIDGIFGMARDITQRKRAEEALQAHGALLATANKELESFAYSVSHDLRAPLRGIDGFSQALLEDYAGRLDDRGKDYLRRVRSASQRMGRLIDDLLALSHTTRREFRRALVDISALAEAVAEDLRRLDPNRQVDIVLASGLIVSGDAGLLRIVLENLLGNAWKFTGTRAQVRIEFGAAVEAGVMTYFVRDNGVGFDMAYVDKLFTPFQRLHGLNEFPGTGIGLATVSRIVQRHGGRIWIEGTVEQGATVFFTL